MEEQRELAFIIDEPSEEDFFNTHKPVATAMSQSILLNDDLKIIGLLGRWGSGKSTIVHEVGSQLRKADEKFLIFNYDAWLHQHDPLRRSFLESLVSFLKNKKAIDGRKWEKILAKLSGALEESKREEAPLVTSEGKLVFVLAGAFALGLSFLKLETFQDGMGKTVTSAGIWTLFVAMTLIIGPFFIWLFYYFYRLDNGKNPSFLPDHLFNRSLGPVHTLTQKDLEPTSIEFGREFRNLMKEVMANGYRLAIIIDNMDRVDDKEAMNIWANARSFFLSEDDDNYLDSADFHPTLILPIDFMSIAQMFAIESDEKKGEALAHSFINKTFDVTFEVPAPVMSDWKRYLFSKMKECLGSHYNEERAFRVRQFLEAWFRTTKTPITPREINKALNRLIALLMQWKESGIPFDTIAWFSINRTLIADKIDEEVVKPGHPLAHISSDWALEIAALYYGVDISLAGQVLMTGPIQRSILLNRPQALDRYRKMAGFDDILHQVTANLPSDDKHPHPNFEVITNAARILAAETDNGPWHAASWKNLILAFNSITGPAYVVSANGFSERMTPLFDQVQEADALNFLVTVQTMIDRLISADNYSAATFEGAGVVGTMLFEFAARTKIDLPIYDVTGDGSKYIKMLAGTHKYPVAQARIRTDASHEELIQELQRRAADQIAAPSVPPLMRLLTSSAAELIIKKPFETIDPLIETFENLTRNNSGDSSMFISAVRSLGAIGGFDDRRRAALQRLAQDGTFANQLSPAAAFGDEEALAIMLAALVHEKADIGSPLGLSWSALFEKHPRISENINSVLDTLITEEEVALDVLLDAFEPHYKPRRLIEELANDRVRRNAVGAVYLAKVIGNLSNYNRMIDWSLRQQFASELTRRKNFWVRMEAVAWSESLLDTARLLEKAGGDEATKFRSQLVEKVEKAPSEEWRAAIEKGSEPFKIVTAFLTSDDIKIGTNSPLVTALVESAPAVAATGKKALGRWFALAEILTARARRKAVSAMGAASLGLPPDTLIKLLKSGGMRLLSEGGFRERGDETVRAIFVPLCRLADGRAWLKDRSLQVRQILDKASKPTQDEFKNIISSCAKSTNPNKRHWGEIMAKELGIDL